ncbi:MAG: hypothetical protein WBN66_00325 [Smithella sp.]
MPIKVEITKIPAYFIWMMGLLEAITVPLVVALPAWTGTGLKNPLHGMVVGFAGVLILFYVINRLLGALRMNLWNSPVIGISIFSSAFWSGLILALIFSIQHVLKYRFPFDYPFKEIIVGFCCAGGAVLICGLIYRIVADRFPFLSINILMSTGAFQVKNFSLWRFSFWAGVYESVALPVILIWSFYPRHQAVVAVITGLAGGIVGGACIWLMAMIFKEPAFIVLDKVTADRSSER